MALEERKWRILRMIIDDYIITATPVGSRSISKRPDIGLSSATIRNEMSDLEEMGYLDQPHTSAGRVPSDKAYRLYVDQMMKKESLSEADILTVRRVMGHRIDQASELIAQTARVLSVLTNYPSAVMAPVIGRSSIKHIQLIPVSEGHALAVIVTDTALVHDALMRVPSGFGAEELERYSRMLTSRLAGRTFEEACILLEDGIRGEFREHRAFFDQIADTLQHNVQAHERRSIALGGAASLFMHPEFNDLEHARNMLRVLETEEIMFKLLRTTKQPLQITITIGTENDVDEMKGASIVTASYRVGDAPVGSLGVIGPTRMDYGRVVSVLEYIGHALSEIFTQRLKENDDSK